MNDNVVRLPCITRLNLNASDILRAIADDEPANVFVIAWPNDGTMPTYHSSTADISTVLMRLNQFIHDYYGGKFGGDDD